MIKEKSYLHCYLFEYKKKEYIVAMDWDDISDHSSTTLYNMNGKIENNEEVLDAFKKEYVSYAFKVYVKGGEEKMGKKKKRNQQQNSNGKLNAV